MEYARALEFLLSFADFERSGRFQDRPDVSPVLALLRRLGDPHLGRRTVHIAGSKGKGSIAAMVESVLRAAGLSTGLYTSPHLHSYCERVRIGGRPLTEGEFARLVGELRPAAEAVAVELGERRLVTFDLLTALAFLAFRRAGVEVQVVEVGLGGRVDSTNVFPEKEGAVIAPLSLEHTPILGDSLEAIAAEKAGIITPGCAVVLAPQAHPEAARVVRERARAVGAALVDVAERYRWRVLSRDGEGQSFELSGPRGRLRLRLPLLGRHQVENAAAAVACVDALGERGLAVPAEAVERGLASAAWPGRLEVLCRRPLVLADGAHNRDSARRLREAVEEHFPPGRSYLVVGTSADKDIDGLAEELAPLAEGVIATRSRHPRAMERGQVAAAFRRLGVAVEEGENVRESLLRAMAAARPAGLICLVVGSLFVAAEARESLPGVCGETERLAQRR